MNRNKVENIVWLLLFVAAMILAALASKSGLYRLVAKIFTTDIYIQAALLILALLIGYSLIFEKEWHILKEVPKSVTAGLATIALLLFAGPIVLPNISKETGLTLLKIVMALIIMATILFLCSFIIKEKGEKGKEIAIKSKLNSI